VTAFSESLGRRLPRQVLVHFLRSLPCYWSDSEAHDRCVDGDQRRGRRTAAPVRLTRTKHAVGRSDALPIACEPVLRRMPRGRGLEPVAISAGLLLPLRQCNPSRFAGARAQRHRSFCCAGCLGIARTIRGLGAFTSSVPSRPSVPSRNTTSDSGHTGMGRPRRQELVRVPADDRREVSLLEGMHCGACVWLIESWLARRPSSRRTSTSRRARLEWSGTRPALSDLLRAIVAIGYRVSVRPCPSRALARRESRAAAAVALLAACR
jgi:hypothetical protein